MLKMLSAVAVHTVGGQLSSLSRSYVSRGRKVVFVGQKMWQDATMGDYTRFKTFRDGILPLYK